MTTGQSGYSDPKIADLAAETAPPKPPTGFVVLSVGLQSTEPPNEKAKIVFRFTRPTKTQFTTTDAVGDDEFTQVTPQKTTVNAVLAALDTVIPVADDLTGIVNAGDYVTITDTTPYLVTEVAASYIRIEAGLRGPANIGDAVYLASKTQECPTDSRLIRLNALGGSTVNVLAAHEVSGQIRTYYWSGLTSYGGYLDLNKVVFLCGAATFICSSSFLLDSGLTPITVALEAASAQVYVTLSSSDHGLLNGDVISFDNGLTRYTVYGSVGAVIQLTTPLTAKVNAGTSAYKCQTTMGESYRDFVIPDFDSTQPLDDLWGYNLYYKETTASQGSKGSIAASFSVSDANLVNNNDGTSDYTFNAPTTWWDGRKIYFSLSSLDQKIPSPNESDADLNAYCITIPGQVGIESFTEDINAGTMTITYNRVTTGGMNPHLYTVMNDCAAQFSKRGGYDVYAKEMTSLSAGDGFYEPIDSTHANYRHALISVGDMVRVVDRISRHIWMTQATVAGIVPLSDSYLSYGSTGVSYLNGHSSLNVSAHHALINPSTDSVLPLDGVDKQYLTDFGNQWTITFATLSKFAVVMQSVDTELEIGKL